MDKFAVQTKDNKTVNELFKGTFLSRDFTYLQNEQLNFSAKYFIFSLKILRKRKVHFILYKVKTEGIPIHVSIKKNILYVVQFQLKVKSAILPAFNLPILYGTHKYFIYIYIWQQYREYTYIEIKRVFTYLSKFLLRTGKLFMEIPFS